MAPLIALFLLVFWWIPTVVGSLPLPVRRFCMQIMRVSRRVVRGFFTLTLLRPAQRRGWFFGLWVCTFVLTLGLTVLAGLRGSLKEYSGILVVAWAWVLIGYLLIRLFPQWFDARALYPLPSRPRRKRWKR
jgi:hypothetical protein